MKGSADYRSPDPGEDHLATCSIQRFDDDIVLEVWNGEFWLFRFIASFDGQSIDDGEDPEEMFELSDVDDAEYVLMEFPHGLPIGYCIFTFYRGMGSDRCIIKCILYGPEGIVGEHPRRIRP